MIMMCACMYVLCVYSIIRVIIYYVRMEERRGYTQEVTEPVSAQRVPHTESDNRLPRQG